MKKHGGIIKPFLRRKIWHILYRSHQIDEIQSRTDKDVVKMSVKFELFSATHIAELRKQDGIWKVVAGPYRED